MGRRRRRGPCFDSPQKTETASSTMAEVVNMMDKAEMVDTSDGGGGDGGDGDGETFLPVRIARAMSQNHEEEAEADKSEVFVWVSWRKKQKIKVSCGTFVKNGPGASETQILGDCRFFWGGGDFQLLW